MSDKNFPSIFPKCPSEIKWKIDKLMGGFELSNAHPYQKGYFHANVVKSDEWGWEGTLNVAGKIFIKGQWKTKRDAQKDIREMAMKYVAEITKELEIK